MNSRLAIILELYHSVERARNYQRMRRRCLFAHCIAMEKRWIKHYYGVDLS